MATAVTAASAVAVVLLLVLALANDTWRQEEWPKKRLELRAQSVYERGRELGREGALIALGEDVEKQNFSVEDRVVWLATNEYRQLFLLVFADDAAHPTMVLGLDRSAADRGWVAVAQEGQVVGHAWEDYDVLQVVTDVLLGTEAQLSEYAVE